MRASRGTALPKSETEATILVALERISSVHRHLLWKVAYRNGISPIQGQILEFLADGDPSDLNVTQIARRFFLTKPTVSDSVSTLISKGLVRKLPCKVDGRAGSLMLTAKGVALSRKIASWSDPLRNRLNEIDEKAKGTLVRVLMELIQALLDQGLIGETRMCIGCANFVENRAPSSEKPHFCLLTGRRISDSDIRFDCPANRPVATALRRAQDHNGKERALGGREGQSMRRKKS